MQLIYHFFYFSFLFGAWNSRSKMHSMEYCEVLKEKNFLVLFLFEYRFKKKVER